MYVYDWSRFRCVVLHVKYFIYKINMFIRFKSLAESTDIVRGERSQSASRRLREGVTSTERGCDINCERITHMSTINI